MLRLMAAQMLRRHKVSRLRAFSEDVEKISKLGLKWLERGGKGGGKGGWLRVFIVVKGWDWCDALTLEFRSVHM